MLKIDQLPKPSGASAVGFYHTSLVDPSRGVELAPQPRKERELPVMVWYPAAAPSGCPVKHYQPQQAFQFNYDLHYRLIHSLPWPLNLMFLNTFKKVEYADIQTNAYQDAPLAETPARLPVLVFAPGYTSFATQNSLLVEDLASHGYVVVAMGVPEETVAEYPDGRITPVSEKVLTEMLKKDNLLVKRLLGRLKAHKKGTPAQLADTTRLFYAPNANEVSVKMNEYNTYVHGRMQGWYEDLLFVLDRLQSIRPLAGRLADDRVGVFGMSMGGGLSSCAAYYQAPRVAATLSLDGCHYGMPYDGKIQTPHMIIHGYDTSRLLFEKMQRDAYYVTVADTEHLDFTDFTLLEPVYRQLGYTGKKVDPQVMVQVMNRYARAFFDKYIKGLDTDGILKGKPLFSNIQVETK